MRETILNAFKTILERYPEIKGMLSGKALEIAENGVKQYEKLPQVENYISKDSDWEVNITEADIDNAIAMWDEVMPEYKGMLNAKVEIDPNKSVTDA